MMKTSSPVFTHLVVRCVVPSALVMLMLKALRILTYTTTSQPASYYALVLTSDVCLIVSALCLTALIASSQRWSIALRIVAVQVLWFPLLLNEIIAQAFYTVTSGFLSFSLLLTYFKHVRLLSGLALSAPPTDLVVFSLGLMAVWSVMPWWRYRRKRAVMLGDEALRPPLPKTGRIGLWLVMMISLALACHPVYTTDKTSIAMQSSLRLVHTALVDLSLPPPGVYSSGTRTLLPRADTSPKHVVLIVLESTRADVTSPYRTEAKKVTPTLDALASKSTVFEHAFAPVPHTSNALFTIHCGIDSPPNLTHRNFRDPWVDCLPRLLAAQGYDTAYFQGATMLFEDRYGLLDLFGYEHKIGGDELDALEVPFPYLNYFGYESKALLEPARAWLAARQDAEAPFLLTFLTLAPHHDYMIPKGFEARALHEDPEFDRYLNCVAYVDAFISDVMELLDEQGVLEQSVVVIVGDHGEAFGEHGFLYHDSTVYQETLHVPLLVMGPGVHAGARIETPTSQLDLLPMMVSLAGFELQGAVPGRNMLEEATRHEPRALRSYCWYERSCAAQIEWPYKLVHHFGLQTDELFDIERDPKEKRNLLVENPESLELPDVDRMRRELLSGYESR